VSQSEDGVATFTEISSGCNAAVTVVG